MGIRIRRAVSVAFAVGVVAAALTACQPDGTLGSIDASVKPVKTCIDTGCFRPVSIKLTGAKFVPNSVLTLLVPADSRIDGMKEVPLAKNVRVTAGGGFTTTVDLDNCVTLPHPDQGPQTLFVAANDASGNRVGLGTIARSSVLCQAPFITPQGCIGIICPSLTVDSRTSIGVHWNRREVGASTYRIRYGLIGDDAHWTQARDFGGDVGDVAINNLAPGTGYGFQVQYCDNGCSSFLDVGRATTKP